MPLIHRRRIVETKIVEQWISQGQMIIRYTNTWDDGIVDTWEGRILIQNKVHLSQRRPEKEEV